MFKDELDNFIINRSDIENKTTLIQHTEDETILEIKIKFHEIQYLIRLFMDNSGYIRSECFHEEKFVNIILGNDTYDYIQNLVLEYTDSKEKIEQPLKENEKISLSQKLEKKDKPTFLENLWNKIIK